jgi:hypothetical protein
MSFHELVGDYPWLVKRMAAVRALSAGQELRQPSRNKLAAVLALFVPRTGMGGGAAAIVPIVMIAVLAAVAIPAYKGYQQRSQEAAAMQALMSGLEQSAKDTPQEAEAAAVNPADRASTPSDH